MCISIQNIGRSISLSIIHDYLSNRKQRTRTGNSYSSWFGIIFGVPQGSIFGSFLSNIFLVDLFFVLKDVDIANFTCDNTLYAFSKNTHELIESLEKDSTLFFDDLRTIFSKSR